MFLSIELGPRATILRNSGRDSEIMFARRETEGDDEGGVGSGGGGAMGRMSTLGVVPGNDGIRRASFGIFDRAGFGTVTFRRDSMAATLFAVQNDDRYLL